MNSASSNSRPVVILLLAAATAGVSIFAWRQSERIQLLEERLAAERDSASAQLATVAQRETKLQQELTAARERERAAIVASAPAPAMRATSGAAGENFRRTRGPNMSALMDNPEFQKAVLTQMRGGLDNRYAALFRRLQLKPDELEKLRNLLVERQASAMDAFAAVRFGESGPADPVDLRRLVEQAQAEIDTNIHALLGDQRFQQYQDFDRNGFAYSVADQLERRLSYSSSPLLPEQAEEIARILAETAPAPTPGAERRGTFAIATAGSGPVPLPMGNADFVFSAGGQPLISDEALIRAADILTPEQLGGLRDLQAEQQASSQVFSTLRRQRGGFEVAAPASPAQFNTVPAAPPPPPPGG